MRPWSFLGRVTVETGITVVVLAFGAAWLFGMRAGIGIAAGGLLGVGNLWWLASAALGALDGQRGWPVTAGLRFAAVAGAAAVMFATGLAHPVAVVVGFTVVPCELIVRGLLSAHAEG
jgi:ATP synthase I subunit